MNKPLDILLVDDKPDDRALAMRVIDREFPNSHYRAVANHRDFSQEMETGGWDLVLTDYQLGWTDGISVVNSAKSRRPDCPVIMLTGSGSEDIAVRAMKAGADDYVLKSMTRNSRLPSAIHLALERAARRRKRDFAEERYTSFFEGVSLGLFRTVANGEITDANPAMLRILRCPSRDVLLGTNVLTWLANPARQRELQSMLATTGEVRCLEAEACCCDGNTIWIEINMRTVGNSDGNEPYCEGSIEDIDAQVKTASQLRETRKQLRALTGNILRETAAPATNGVPPLKYPLSKRIGHRLILEGN